MSMSTHVIGFRPPDEKWKKMKAAYDACAAAGIDIPDDVTEFFNGEVPDDRGVEVQLEYLKGKDVCLTPWQNDSYDGYDLDITKLPKDVTLVRFYNSW